MPEYIPPGDNHFDHVIRNQVGPYVNDHYAALGLTAADNTAFQAVVSAWGAAWGDYGLADTALKTALTLKDEKRAEAVAALRTLAQRVQTNPAVADTHRAGIGLVPRKRTKTRVGVPSSVPVVRRADTSNRAILRLFFSDSATPESRAKPAGVRSCEIRQQIGGAAPTDPEAMSLLAIATRSPYRADYEATAVGQTVYFALRWRNTKGAPGPWSQMFSAVVPG